MGTRELREERGKEERGEVLRVRWKRIRKSKEDIHAYMQGEG